MWTNAHDKAAWWRATGASSMRQHSPDMVRQGRVSFDAPDHLKVSNVSNMSKQAAYNNGTNAKQCLTTARIMALMSESSVVRVTEQQCGVASRVTHRYVLPLACCSSVAMSMRPVRSCRYCRRRVSDHTPDPRHRQTTKFHF